MKSASKAPATVAEYIARQDRTTQAILKKLRATVLKAAPDAEERISYQMPAYFMKGVLVYFAAWEKHIGLYPGSQAIEEFAADLTTYVHAKGSIQFPLDRPMPYGLVTRIVKYRVTQKSAGRSSGAVGGKRVQKGALRGKGKSATTGSSREGRRSTTRGATKKAPRRA